MSKGIEAVEGVRCFGVKKGKHGLGIAICRGKAAGVFTNNRVKAAPLLLTREHVKSGEIEGIIVNSGCANAYTGSEGMAQARGMAKLLSNALGTDLEKIGVASTGTIGTLIDMEWLDETFKEVFGRLEGGENDGASFVSSMMTTDTFQKTYGVEVDGVRTAGVTKGSGMIAPDMATMLSFLFTEADLTAEELQVCLDEAVGKSFNMLVVDGDTSTNDTVLLVSTGRKHLEAYRFQEALDAVCIELAKQMARDGEGATTYVEVEVRGARTDEDARKVARTIITSPLVKTAIFGGDPNWGRVIAAAGYAGVDLDPEHISLGFSSGGEEIKVLGDGEILDYDLKSLEALFKLDEVFIHLGLDQGDGNAIGFGCDFSYDYVKINAEYMT